MIVHGQGELLVPAHLNFGRFFVDRLRKVRSDDTCLVNCTTGAKFSYGDFINHAVRVCVALTELGVARGDTVAVAGEPRATSIPTTLAVILTGAAYTPLALECGKAILAHKLNLTRPKYVICTRLFWETYSDVLKDLKFIETLICFDDIDDIKLSVATMASRHVNVKTFEPATVRGEDVAVILYSSGTTGMSKGVLLTHLNCIARCDTQGFYDFESSRIVFVPTDLCSSYTIFPIFSCIVSGKTVVYSDNDLDFKGIEVYQVDSLFTYPTIVEQILTDETETKCLSSLKILYSGTFTLPTPIAKTFKERYPFIKLLDVYGTTEAYLITGQDPSLTETGNIGFAAPCVSIKVVDVETRVALGPNQHGEICVWSPCLMKGYLGATSPYMDEQGFYLTGDLGYYDDHKRFYHLDRMTDLIPYMRYNVYPGHVESVLLGHPAVLEAAVVGKPAGTVGELPTAFVVLRPGARGTETELVDYVAKEVTSYMRLTGGVRLVSELPRSSRQKVLRRRLRQMLELEQPNASIETQ